MTVKRRLYDIDVTFISLVEKGANKKTLIWKSQDKEAPELRHVKIRKTDEEKRLIYCIVYSPGEVDSQGDMATAQEVEKAAYRFMEKRRTNQVDYGHDFKADEGFVAESWLTKENDALFGEDPLGSWAVGIKITNDDTWEAIKKGDITGVSLAGYAKAVEMEKSLSHNNNIADDEPDWSDVDKTKLPRSAFADKGEADKKSTWKYPHHWVKNGKVGDSGIYESGDMYLHRGGLNAAWTAANGARSGKKAPQEVIDHLQAHRKKLGLEKSFFTKLFEKIGLTKDFSDEYRGIELENAVNALERSLHKIFWDEEGNLTPEQKRDAIKLNVEQFLEIIDKIDLKKEGRVFSATNIKQIKAAYNTLGELIKIYESQNKKVEKMNAEEIKKLLQESLQPISERLEKLEKRMAASADGDDGKDGDNGSKGSNEEVEKAIQKALEPVLERLDKIEKASPGRQSSKGGDDKGEGKGLKFL